jgi:TonB family protein
VDTDQATAARLRTPFGVGQELRFPRVTPKFSVPEDLVALETGPPSPADGTNAVAQAPEAPPTSPAPVLDVSLGQVALNRASDPTIAPAPTPNSGSATPGGAQQPAADPARMSDSESDPFSKLGTVIFREGSLDIRFGRKVKTRRPKLLLAARSWDAVVIRKPDVGLRIDVDAMGKVTSVAVTKSSGSNEIDQPTRVAVYDWWFEPKLDADGRPVAEQYRFVIGYR